MRTVLIKPATTTSPVAPPANHNAAAIEPRNRTIGIRHAIRCARRIARTELRLASSSAYSEITRTTTNVVVDCSEASLT